MSDSIDAPQDGFDHEASGADDRSEPPFEGAEAVEAPAPPAPVLRAVDHPLAVTARNQHWSRTDRVPLVEVVTPS